MLTERIKRLREQSLEAIPTLSHERALLVTEFYRNQVDPADPPAIQRARCFEYLFDHKTLCILDGELVVGERGPSPKATPTYPEICIHSLDDLEILHGRSKVSFSVSEETRKVYKEEIIPFWKGKTHRDRLFAYMTDDWKAAYDAGIFTEFQEQRAPGHTVMGKKIYSQGLNDMIREIEERLDRTGEEGARKVRKVQGHPERSGHGNPATVEEKSEWKAMVIVAKALISYAERNADLLSELATVEEDADRRNELLQMESVCRRVPANAPETMHEALQYYWFVHLGVISELNPWDAFNPGRLDQHLLPFYEQDLASGRLNPDRARELLQAFWVKFNNHPSPPKIGVTAQESGTYTDFCLINLGGLDEEGNNAVNQMSFILMDVIEEMRLLQPSSMVQVSSKNPDAFIDRALQIVKTGFGQPSIFNTDAIIRELLNQGKEIIDARNGGASGCVETGAFGTEAYFLTGYFNLVKILELTLHNGVDPRSGKQLGPATGDPATLDSMASLRKAFEEQLHYFIRMKLEGNNIIERLFAEHLPVPFLSLFIDDCVANGMDYNAGGARYNTSYIQGVGLGSVTDMFSALQHHIYDRKSVTMDTMLKLMKEDFRGNEEIRAAFLYDTPKYGNDSDLADAHAVWVFEAFHRAVDGFPNTRGGVTRINMLPTTSHVYFGSVVGAMPDGRHAWEPLSEGISPFQGMDVHGPTAVLRSAAKIDHLKTGGTLLNQKFTPEFFKDDQAITKIRQLVRTYFRMMGHHIQFNVVSADTLRDAQKHPEKYRDLIVRVAGYSDYFNDLGEALQDEIIRRTEQGSF